MYFIFLNRFLVTDKNTGKCKYQDILIKGVLRVQALTVNCEPNKASILICQRVLHLLCIFSLNLISRLL